LITVSAAPAIAIAGFGDRDALVSVIAISELRRRVADRTEVRSSAGRGTGRPASAINLQQHRPVGV
jgi:hypothetical protein